MSLENLQTLSKLKKKLRAQLFCKENMRAATQKKSCARIFFWVWREFGDSPNSFFLFFKIFRKFLKITSNKDFFVSLEWVFSKLDPNSYVFIFLFFLLNFFFGKEEWIWSEFGDSPNSLQTRSKLKWFHFGLMFFPLLSFSFLFGKDERLWSEFGDSPNSLQTHSKLAPNSYVFIFLFLFFFFWKEEWYSARICNFRSQNM